MTANLAASDTGACTTAAACLTLNLAANSGAAVIQLSGTFSGTVQFEATANNGTTWVAVNGNPIGGTTAVTSATSAGAWRVGAAGFNAVRVRCSTYGSGTIVTVITSSPASASSGGIGTPASPTSQVVQPGLMAEYRILPSESAAGLVDYSGNGNNATGTVGTAPTIIPVTGGISPAGTGAVSLPAALNSAQTIQIFFGDVNANGGLVAGNGSTASSLILLVTEFQQSTTQVSGDSLLNGGVGRVLGGWLQNGNNTAVYPRAAVAGNMSVAWDMACDAANNSNDAFYINALPVTNVTDGFNYILQQRCSQGHQTTGNYQLGGISTCTNYVTCGYYSGQIYYALFYNRPLTAAEVAQNANYMAQAMAARGVIPGPRTYAVNQKATALKYTLLVDGDSLSCGACVGVTPPILAPWASYLTLNPASTWNTTVQARAGALLFTDLNPGSPFAVDTALTPVYLGNLVMLWAGTNDNDASAEPAMQGYCTARHALKWKCAVATMISRTGEDTFKNTYNLWIRQNWNQFADALVDLASNPNIGADGASASSTYFATDGIHTNNNGIINNEVPLFQQAINRLYGNRDFSTATTYTTGATAAVATTAVTEATNTVTVTFSATPANCQKGNMITLAGITPSGYNGTFLILTRNSTQVTAFNQTTGLGNASGQGTGVCPQQQDADQFAILGGSGLAQSFTLESCQGYTGQSIYLKGEDTNAWTVTPFGAETIDGGSTLALALNTTVQLQSVLVSAAAGGCNWITVP